MRLTFLGTGTSTGVPVIGCKCKVCQSNDVRDKRMRASVFLEVDDKNILIDCGPDFRAQMLFHDIDQIDAILLTHKHIDHIGGIDDLRPLGNKKIYLDKQTEDAVRQMYGYCFAENPYPGVPSLSLEKISYEPFKICDGTIEVIPIRVMHGKMEIMGYRIGNFAYITDVSSLADDAEYEKLKGLEVVVLGCLRMTEHHSHQKFQEAMEMAKRINAKQTFFTHMCHHIGLHSEIEDLVPENIMFAYDGLSIAFE
ncbi:MAG: MBL fold metallo-hydrolase [Paludibacteraceae bacterium]|nr:MBL fold metallo-hydrolase [Paludibacteraceae bacterium]